MIKVLRNKKRLSQTRRGLWRKDDAKECGFLDEILKHKRILVGKPGKSGRKKKKKVYSLVNRIALLLVSQF